MVFLGLAGGGSLPSPGLTKCAQIRVSRHHLGGAILCSPREWRHRCLFKWCGGSFRARSNLHSGLSPEPLPTQPAAKPKGQWEELNMTATWGGVGGQVTCARAKVQKKKTTREWQIDALGTKFKLDFCLGPEVIGFNSLVPNPCQGCSDPSPVLANASLAAAGSGSRAALVFPAPSSGWTGLLVTSLPSLPLNQLVLLSSNFYLKVELKVPFLCPGRLLLAPLTPLSHDATRWRAGASQMGPGEASPTSLSGNRRLLFGHCPSCS